MMDKLISQQAAIDKIKKRLYETAFNNVGIKQNVDETLSDVAENRLENWFGELPSVQPKLKELSEWKADFKGYINALNMPKDDYDGIMEYIDEVPYTQPDAVTASLEELINDYGEDGYFIVDGVNYQANELLNELKINSSIGEKFRIQITKTIVAYFMKFGD